MPLYNPQTGTPWGGITGTLSSQTDLNTALIAKAPLASPTFTGTVSGVTAAMVGAPSGSGTSTGSNTGDQTSVSGNAGTVTTNANLTGDVTSVGNATTLTNAPVIAKVLTGYISGAGVVAATDTILQAVQKLNGNKATNANLTGDVTSVGNATTITGLAESKVANLTTDLAAKASLTGIENLTNKTFSVATGTTPFAVASTTKVTNLNADMVDGIHASATATASTLLPLDGAGKLTESTFPNLTKLPLSGNSSAPTTPAAGLGVLAGVGTSNIGLAFFNELGVQYPLVSTIATGTNAGTATGDTNFLQIGKLKICWGTTASLTCAATVTNYGVTFPITFAAAPKVISMASGTQTGDNRCLISTALPTTTSVGLTSWSMAGGATSPFTWIAIGT